MEKEIKVRKRKPKFTLEENRVLVENYSKNSYQLNKKFGPETTHAKKSNIWKEITNAVNAVSDTPRTVQDVMNRWKEHKKSSKEKVVQHRKESKKTGGGPQPPDPDPLDEMAAAAIGKAALTGIPGGGMEVGGLENEEDNLEMLDSPPPIIPASTSPRPSSPAKEPEEWSFELALPLIAADVTEAATQTVMTGDDSMAALLAQGERQIAVHQRLAEAIEKLVERAANTNN